MRLWPLALFASVLLGPPALAAVPMGEPTVGDFWETLTSEGDREVVSRASVVAIEDLSLNGTTYRAARVVTYTNETIGSGAGAETTRTVRTSWSRLSDGALLKTTTRRVAPPPFPDAEPFETTAETTYDSPCVRLVFPLEVEGSWSTTCQSTTTSQVAGQAPSVTRRTETDAFRVLREERVSVPAGDFSALLLQVNITSNGTSVTEYRWYAPAACADARTMSDAGDLVVRLTSYRCARPAPPTSSPPVITSVLPTPGLPGPELGLVVAVVLGAAVIARRR